MRRAGEIVDSHASSLDHVRLALQYLDALDTGDFEALDALWRRAAGDAELERTLHQLNEGLAVEQGGEPSLTATARVQEFLHKHLPRVEDAPEPRPAEATLRQAVQTNRPGPLRDA